MGEGGDEASQAGSTSPSGGAAGEAGAQESGQPSDAAGDAPGEERRRLAAVLAKMGDGRSWVRDTYSRTMENILAFIANRTPAMWLLALMIGAAVGAAAVVFRLGIGAVQWLWLGEMSEYTLDAISAQPWWVIVAATTVGGAIVGLFNALILDGRRPGAVADVIEASARGGRGVSAVNGLWSACATVISLGAGASAGREGPVVHLGATLAAGLTRIAQLPPQSGRVILACGAASAISASFNAPIAGVLFAHEVILRHYAVSAFVPIVIASVSGTLVARLLFIGNVAAFQIPTYAIGSYWEMPAFALLGVVAAGVAVTFQFALIVFDQTARAIIMPAWARPIIGGLVVGVIGAFAPEILGVGYEATDTALHGGFLLWTMMLLVVLKILATAVTLASRFGGGIFSPSLYLGAMTGGSFGIIAAMAFPDLASDHGLYAILGMGAVASALLGAPISTTVIVFELTGGYALSIALLLTVSIATGLHLAVHGRSFFHYQLETRGVVLASGPHRYFLKTITVATFMTPAEEPETLTEETDRPKIRSNDTLETALRHFNESGADLLLVVDPRDRALVVGTVSHVQALRAYNRQLVETSEEEHR
ncbi:chloride channel protein [Acuticoccus kandeliae]|uniref:chloride channel protein n=1 Tax=Acuticoccus kandeliae TaxID=2073160 RepID=UPI001FEA28E2|nr:chloride channel protein [Acuticoccus kandeliae]